MPASPADEPADETSDDAARSGADEAEGDEAEPAPRSVASRKKRRGGGGGVMAAAMLGLRDVFEEPIDDEIAIVIDDDEALRDADGMSVRLDPDSPPKSSVRVHGVGGGQPGGDGG